jgi:hypothetical protein
MNNAFVASAKERAPTGTGAGVDSNCVEPPRAPVDSSSHARRKRIRRNVVFAAGGLGLLAVVIASANPAQTWSIIQAALVWLPLLFLLEAFRIAFEGLATWSLVRNHPAEGTRLDARTVFRTQLSSYAVCMGLPAGRAAAEAFKATVFARLTHSAYGMWVGVTCQSLCLLVNSIIGLLCGIVCFAYTGWSTLTLAVMLQILVTTMLGVLMVVGSRNDSLNTLLDKMLQKRFPDLQHTTDQFFQLTRARPPIPQPAFVLYFFARFMQVLEHAVALYAVAHITLRTLAWKAWVAEAVNLVSTGAADLIPGQVGAIEGAFSLAAPLLHIDEARAISVAILMHTLQFFWIIVSLGSLVWTLRRASDACPVQPSSPTEPAHTPWSSPHVSAPRT